MLAPSGIGGSAIKSPAIFLVVPAYNPGGSIIEVVRKALPHVAQVVIVDDGCDAAERAYLRQCLTDEKVTLLVHDFNKGKGVALHTGISHCLAGMQEDDFILTMDSDGQHDPEDIPKFKHLLAQEGDVHFVLGERFEDGEMPTNADLATVWPAGCSEPSSAAKFTTPRRGSGCCPPLSPNPSRSASSQADMTRKWTC